MAAFPACRYLNRCSVSSGRQGCWFGLPSVGISLGTAHDSQACAVREGSCLPDLWHYQ